MMVSGSKIMYSFTVNLLVSTSTYTVNIIIVVSIYSFTVNLFLATSMYTVNMMVAGSL